MTISPSPTCTTMFRAISEIAVAINVASVRVKPSRSASVRASARAGTRSASEAMRTRTSSPAIPAVPLCELVEHCDRLVEVEGSAKRLEVEVEVHHCDRDVGLDADDHGFGPPQPGGDRDRAERARDERVDDVHRADVDDDPTRAN